MTIRFGAGYNPRFLEPDPTARIELPGDVSHVEMGLREFARWKAARPAKAAISLHLARSPITESPDRQRAFMDFLAPLAQDPLVEGLGFHLTGPQEEGIGKYGFSSHYSPNPSAEERAIGFIKEMKARTGLPVWIENANFYSEGASAVVQAWGSLRRILDAAGAGLIVDLSHLLIEARNLGVDPRTHLGLPAWEYVEEIHVSGVVTGSDGAMHDGHGEPVHPEVWSLLSEAMAGLGLVHKPIVVTIEHTDPGWSVRKEAFESDHAAVRAIVASAVSRAARSRHADAARYARGNILRLACQRVPKLRVAVEQRGLSLGEILDCYLEDAISRGKKRLVLTLEEVPPRELPSVEEVVPAFVEFVKARLSRHEVRA